MASKKSLLAKVGDAVTGAASTVVHAADANVIQPAGKALGLTGGAKKKPAAKAPAKKKAARPAVSSANKSASVKVAAKPTAKPAAKKPAAGKTTAKKAK